MTNQDDNNNNKDCAVRSLTNEERHELLEKAQQSMQTLWDDIHQSPATKIHQSWLNGTVSAENISESCRFFDKHGFLHMKGFSGT